MKKLSRYSLGLTLLLLPSFGQAYNFKPTQAEFNSWDSRCKKAYSATGPGRSSGYYPKLSPQQNTQALRFAEEAGGAWHYCAGVIYLQRATALTGQEREGYLKRAVSEMEFTARNISLDNSWYPEIQIDVAKVYFESENYEKSFAILTRLIQTHPNNSLSYTALAYFLKKNKQLDQAIAILQNAPVLLLNESAELNYFLGWYLMERGKSKEAVTYAKRAYELNYPAPALRQRLAAKGLSW